MHFTAEKKVRADKKILLDLEKIVKLIVKNIPNVNSLILVGSFGRGEGSVLLEDAVLKPINDYDIVLITNTKCNHAKLKQLSRYIVRKIGIRLVDLVPLRKDILHELPCTMFNYDLKNGGYIFYGDREILELVPQYDPTQMPLDEGKRLLFNRMICLLESYSEEFRERELNDSEKFFLVNQTSKAILACCDSSLLLKGKYHHSYAEKNERFSKIFKNDGKMVFLVQQATNFKLKPYREIDFDAVKYWFETRDIFVRTLRTFLEILYTRKFENWVEFSRYYLNHTRPIIKRWADKIRRRQGVLQKVHLEMTEIYLLAARTEHSLDEKYLKMAYENLKRITLANNMGKFFLGSSSVSSWENLRKTCVDLWFSFLH